MSDNKGKYRTEIQQVCDLDDAILLANACLITAHVTLGLD